MSPSLGEWPYPAWFGGEREGRWPWLGGTHSLRWGGGCLVGRVVHQGRYRPTFAFPLLFGAADPPPLGLD